MRIPLLDLKSQYKSIAAELSTRLDEVIHSQRFILGPSVAELEEAIARYLHVKHAVGCASGTDALLLSLKTLNLKPGDEVITTPFTFFATAGAIHNAGGRPVFVDIDPQTFNLDVDAVASAVTPRTRAIVPVHLYGQTVRVERLLSIAEQHSLAIVEDCAQAIGARRKLHGDWRMAGGFGAAGALSFFPSKNLGCWGDGGMIVTNDESLADRLRKLRAHGGAKQYHHEEIGTNSRLDTVQAAVLLAKLPHLDTWNAGRRSRAESYDQALDEVDGVLVPHVDRDNEHVYHQYTIRAERRNELKAHLDSLGIGSAVYYPKPLHLQPCFAALGYRPGQFPHSECAADSVLSLPIYPELPDADQSQVIDAIRGFYQ